MRFLFVSEGGAGSILPIVPLAQAVRSGGHEVFAAAYAEAMPLLLDAGLPAVAAPRKAPRDYRAVLDGKLAPLPDDVAERAVVLGALGARIAADTYHDLVGLVREWHPDVIVGGPLASAASLLSAEFGIPLATVEFGMAEPLARQVATVDELHRLGFTHVPPPTCGLIMCPESIRPAGSVAGEPMRYVSYAPAKPVEPWMYTKGDLPRVLVSAGSRVSADYALDYLTDMIHAVVGLDVELLVATPDDVAEQLGPLPPTARAGWMPFDVLAPTCDLAVHHGGGSTMLGCAAASVPQVVIPYTSEFATYYQPLADYGAAKLIMGDDDTPSGLRSACEEMLTEPSYRLAAARLRAELDAAPSPLAVVGRLESIAAGR